MDEEIEGETVVFDQGRKTIFGSSYLEFGKYEYFEKSLFQFIPLAAFNKMCRYNYNIKCAV